MYRGHKSDVNCSAFSPCGRFIISCSGDKLLKVWETKPIVTKDRYIGEGTIIPFYSEDKNFVIKPKIWKNSEVFRV